MVKRTISKSRRQGKVYWLARERRKVVARADTLEELEAILSERDASGLFVEDEEVSEEDFDDFLASLDLEDDD